MARPILSRATSFVVKEVREALPATILFLFLFHMVALTRAVSVGDYSFGALRATTATVGALLVAKAILVAEALPIARLPSRRRAAQVAWRVVLFGLMVLVFRLVEEIVPLVVEHGELPGAVRALAQEISWPIFWVTTMWVLGGVFFYCVAAELVHELGAGKVREIFFGNAST